jgi:hypothetical protein
MRAGAATDVPRAKSATASSCRRATRQRVAVRDAKHSPIGQEPAVARSCTVAHMTYKMIRELRKLLMSLDGCLDKAVAYATHKKFDPSVLMHARLAPDMFPFARQVQSACDQAKYAAARGAGKEAPAHEDKETTVPELKARIASVVTYLDTFSEADFAGIADRTVSLPRWEGKSLSALDYVVEHAVPNFFFHFTTAYAILRHNGVDVGKRDYLGALSFKS